MPHEDVFHPCSWPCDWKINLSGLECKGFAQPGAEGIKGGGDRAKAWNIVYPHFYLFLPDIDDQTGAGQRPRAALAELGTFPTQVPAQKLGQAAWAQEEDCEEGVYTIPSITTREQGMLGKPYYIFPGNQLIMWIYTLITIYPGCYLWCHCRVFFFLTLKLTITEPDLLPFTNQGNYKKHLSIAPARLFCGCNSGSSLQVDKELATGEFFLRESVKKRKKMEAIKVNECCTVFSSTSVCANMQSPQEIPTH